MRVMTRLLLLLATFISSLVLQAQENSRLQIISDLVHRGVSSEDSSYVEALYWYEQAADSISVLDNSSGSALMITIGGHGYITTSAFIDSVLPVARKRAAAETDLFECGMLVAEALEPENHLDPVRYYECDMPGLAQPHFREMALETCLKYDRLDLARRFDLRQLVFVDSAEYYEEFVGVACRRGAIEIARALMDSLLDFIGNADFRNRGPFPAITPRFEGVFKKFAQLLPRSRQVEWLDKYAVAKNSMSPNTLWLPDAFLAEEHLRLDEFKKAEEYAVKASEQDIVTAGYTLMSLYYHYRSASDTLSAERILNLVYSMSQVLESAIDLNLETFLITELTRCNRIDEADRVLWSTERNVLASLDLEYGEFELSRLVRLYLDTDRTVRGVRLLDSLRRAADDGHPTFERIKAIVDEYVRLGEYSAAEAIIKQRYPSYEAAECAFSVVLRLGYELKYEQADRFAQYITDSETSDLAWEEIAKPHKGYSYLNEQALKRTKNIKGDVRRLGALSDLVLEMYDDLEFEPYLTEAEVLCEQIDVPYAKLYWYEAAFAAARRSGDITGATSYLRRCELTLKVDSLDERSEYDFQFSSFFRVAENYACLGLAYDAERVLNQFLLPRVASDEDRRYLAIGLVKIGRLASALKIIPEITNDCERGLALIEFAALSENGIPKSDNESLRRMHQIVRETQR